MKPTVTIRTKPLSGDRFRIYFDFYPSVILPGAKKSTRRKFTDLFLYAKPHSPQEKEHNKQVQIEADLIRAKYLNILNQREFYSEIEKEAYLRKQIEKQSFTSFYISLLEKRSGETKRQWKTTLHCLQRFHPTDILFSDIQVHFVESFKSFLLSPEATNKKKKLHQNTSQTYFKPFRVALNSAYRYGYLSKDYCKIVSDIKLIESKRNFLTSDEVKMLISTPCADEEIKRASLFSIYTGLRLSDIQSLKWENIIQSEHGASIDFRQKKTKGLEVLPISQDAESLLGKSQPGDLLIFPTLYTKKNYNDIIKEWVEKANIRKHITFHSFRHTNATLLLKNGAEIVTVSKLMGHKSLKTTMVYIKILDDTKRAAVELLKFV